MLTALPMVRLLPALPMVRLLPGSPSQVNNDWVSDSGRPDVGMQLISIPDAVLDMDETISGGVLVTTVAEGSASAFAGIRSGDVIVSVNGKPVRRSPPEEIQCRVNQCDRLELLVASTAPPQAEGRTLGVGVFANRSIRRTRSRRITKLNVTDTTRPAAAFSAGPAREALPAEATGDGLPPAVNTDSPPAGSGAGLDAGDVDVAHAEVQLQELREAVTSFKGHVSATGSESDSPLAVTPTPGEAPPSRAAKDSGEYGFDRGLDHAGSMSSLPSVLSEEEVLDAFLPAAGGPSSGTVSGGKRDSAFVM